MKKFATLMLSLLLSLIMVLGIAGCGEEKTPDTGDGGTTNGGTTEDNTGSGNNDEDNKGSGNTDEDNKGSGNTDEDNKGSGNTDEDNKGSGNTDEDNKGSGNTDEDNKGSGNTDEDNKGSSNTDEDDHGDEPDIGPQMTEAELNAALEASFAATNYTASVTATILNLEAVEMLDIENAQKYERTSSTEGETWLEVYRKLDGDKVYVYSNNSGEWLRMPMGLEEDQVADYFETSSIMLTIQQYVEKHSWSDYSAVEYDEETGVYTAGDMTMTFRRGKLHSFAATRLFGDDYVIYFRNYGTTVVNVPQYGSFNQEKLSALQAAVEKTRAAENFTFSYTLEVEGYPFPLSLTDKIDTKNNRSYMQMGVEYEGNFMVMEEDYYEIAGQNSYLFVWSRYTNDNGQFDEWGKPAPTGTAESAKLNVYMVHYIDILLWGVEDSALGAEALYLLSFQNEENVYQYKSYDIINRELVDLTFEIGAEGYIDKVTIVGDPLQQGKESTYEFFYTDFNNSGFNRPNGLPAIPSYYMLGGDYVILPGKEN